jgi:glycosyltransferase involved in cell wall biosynthesis
MNKKIKKIIITIDWFSPAYKAGGPIQSIVNMVNQLEGKASFYIVCGHKDVDGAILEKTIFNQWVDYNDHTKVWYAEKKHINLFKDLSESVHPDMLFCIGLFSPFFNWLPLFSVKTSKKIWSVRGMLHPGALSQKSWKKKLFLYFVKKMKLYKNIYFHATDFDERNFIQQQIFSHANIFIAGNFSKSITPETSVSKMNGFLRLLTVALISPMKNHLLVLAALAECKGEIDYHIAGAIKDQEYWEKCLRFIQTLPSNIHVHYHGEIEPEQVQFLLNSIHVSINPSESENFGHSIVEALQAGKPVITSNNTPWKKLHEHQAGFNVDLNKIELKFAIEKFVGMNQDEYNLYSHHAIEYIRGSVNTPALINSYENMFNLLP